MDPHDVGTQLAEDLRRQPWYRGQLLRRLQVDGAAADLAPIEDVEERLSDRNVPSLSKILNTLGKEEIRTEQLAFLRQAFNPETLGDAVLVGPVGPERELAWQLTVLLEFLDRAGTSLVVARNAQHAEILKEEIDYLIGKADMDHVVQCALLLEQAQIEDFNQEFCPIAVVSPDAAASMLAEADQMHCDAFFSSLQRIVLPACDSYGPEVLTNLSAFFRWLQVACGSRGTHPALLATVNYVNGPAQLMQRVISRPIDSDAVISSANVHPALDVFLFAGAMDRNPDAEEWVRQHRTDTVRTLADYLTGKWAAPVQFTKEFHYLLDCSGSMEGSLEDVKDVVRKHLEQKKDAGVMTGEDRLRLSWFHHEAHLNTFEGQADESGLDAFRNKLNELTTEGGTETVEAMKQSLTTALQTPEMRTELVVFSDGIDDIDSAGRQDLLELQNRSRAEGIPVSIVYVDLEETAEPDVHNLVTDLGGSYVNKPLEEIDPADDLVSPVSSSMVAGDVLLVAGEEGVSREVLQTVNAREGPRGEVVYVNDINEYNTGSREVGAVIVTGKYRRLKDLVADFGDVVQDYVPIFLVAEPDPWTQWLGEDFLENDNLARLIPVAPTNASVLQRWLPAFMDGCIRYVHEVLFFLEGEPRYDAWCRGEDPPPEEVPGRFRQWLSIQRTTGRNVVELMNGPQGTDNETDTSPVPGFHLYGRNPLPLKLSEGTIDVDGETAGMLLPSGADVPSYWDVAEVVSADMQQGIATDTPSPDKVHPLLSGIRVEPEQPGDWDKPVDVAGWGVFEAGPCCFSCSVDGVRKYPDNILDRPPQDSTFTSPEQIQFQTEVLRWKPDGVNGDADQAAVLGDVVRVALSFLIPEMRHNALVHSDDEGSVWIVELAPGGNGFVRRLNTENVDVLEAALRATGHILLECLCEGGFEGAGNCDVDSGERFSVGQGGCPLCLCPIRLAYQEAPPTPNKRQAIEWLNEHNIAPSSTNKHLDEKYRHVSDIGRITGVNQGTRKSVADVINRIYRDRLGIDMAEALRDTSIDWMSTSPGEPIARYLPEKDLLELCRLPEWYCFDSYAHAALYAWQHKGNWFNLDKLTGSDVPFQGELFREGAAVWAKSHVMDALLMRTTLNKTDLRIQRDEYVLGFQFFKLIEEHHGGVPAVMTFLRTGDINQATDGQVSVVEELYRQVGIPENS